MVPSYRLVQSPEAAKAVLLSDDFNPAREAILYNPPLVRLSGDNRTATASIVDYAANEVTIQTKSDHDGLLVLSDTYYPGWNAYVDGQKKTILQANVCQRAVEVPSGEHVVRFTFDSGTIKAGFGISVLSLLIVGGLLAASLRKRTPID